MKLLVVGHTYITAFAQEAKYVPMKQLDRGLRLLLVVPYKFNHVFMKYKQETAVGMEPEEVVSVKTIFNNSHMTYIFNPIQIACLLIGFKPDLIHIEEEPHSLVAAEIILLAGMICKKAKISFFTWDNLVRRPLFPLNILKWALTKYALSRCALVICGNGEAKQLLRDVKKYYGRSSVLPQIGINQKDYVKAPSAKVIQRLAKKQDEVLIGFIGRLIPEKGIILLLEVLFRLRYSKWKLLIVGSGPLKDEIKTRWQTLLGSRLIFVDAVVHKDVSDYLRCLDIFVLPSYSTEKWKEQFGLTLAQAMMAGVACVGSSSGAIPEVMGSGGTIFQERDIESLTNALDYLIRSEEKIKELGKKAQEFAFQHYTSFKVARAYSDAFNGLINPEISQIN